MEDPSSEAVASRAEPLGSSPPTVSKIDELPMALCWSGLLLFVAVQCS